MAEKKIAFLIITFNAAGHLDRLLNSIEKKHSVLAVDNGSTDETFKILEERNIQFIKNNRNGYSAGINKGLEHLKKSDFDFVFILNQDTQILNLEINFPLFEKYAIIQPIILNEDLSVGVDELKMNVFGFIYPFRYRKKPVFESKEIIFFSGAGFILNMHKYALLGDFDENYFMYYEDADYSAKCYLNNEKIFLNKDIRIIHFYKNSVSSFSKIKLLLHSRRIFTGKYLINLWRILLFIYGGNAYKKQISCHNKINFSKYILKNIFMGFSTRQISFPVRVIINIFSYPYSLFVKLILKTYFVFQK